MSENQKEAMRALIDQLNRASVAYYTNSVSLMSDAQWDKLYDELGAMEKAAGFSLPDSPTRRVGAEPLKAFAPHRHIHRLWSMDKVQSKEALRDWISRTEKLYASLSDGRDKPFAPLSYAVEYKLDGLTINLTYEHGQLIQAATRGNGEVGEGVLEQARTIRCIPLTIPYQGLIEVHGECIMQLSVLSEYNKTAQEPLKNARNAAAGAIRNLDPAVTASRRLSAFFYEISTIEDPPYHDEKGMMDFIKENGLPVSPFVAYVQTREEIEAQIDLIEKRRDELDFLIDGAVVKIVDDDTREAFGYTEKFPRWAVAFKFAAEENVATLLDVTWELGRTGKLTPLAHLTPVDIGGVTVRRATLNNEADIRRKDVSIGCDVWIRRSNDVIPEILGRVGEPKAGETPIDPPAVCPACGQPLTQRGAHLFCLNRESCMPQAVARIAHFAGRNAMDIDGFSEKTAEALYQALDVRDPADLYHLTAEQLLPLEGFQQKKADNLISALAQSRHCKLDAFLFGIGIPNVGRKTARDLANHFTSLDAVRQATLEELTAIPEIGEIVAGSVTEFFSYPENLLMVDRLLQAGVTPVFESDAVSDKLKGKTLVVTGTLPTLSRQEAEALIAAHGGKPASSVSKKTDYVVAGEKAGSKLTKAQELGVPVLTEEQFTALLNE